ncbi:hypothetical protein [Calothrix sp. CCY 0018]
MLNWATGLGTSLDKHGFGGSTSTHCGGLAATVESEVSETSSILERWAG